MIINISKRRICLKYFGFIFIMTFYIVIIFRMSFHVYKNQNPVKEQSKPKGKIAHFSERKPSSKFGNKYHDDLETSTDGLSTVNPVYEYSEELHIAIETELLARRDHLWNICVKENIINVYPPNAWEFFISPGHNIAWCNVFKAASSTWMYYFNILAGYDIKFLQRTKTSPLELARRRFPRPKKGELKEALANSMSFLTVRDPFERLLSAYRDKLEGCRNKFYKVLGKQIIKAFRNNTHLKKYNSGPTFKEFLLFLIQSQRKGKQFDEHWTPIYKFCTPCSINYTLIAKVETFQRDTEYIIRQTGLEPLLLGKLPQNGKKKISNQSSKSTKSLIEKYFSQIDRNTLDEVGQIYRLDFELFGYNITKYYQIAQQFLPTITGSYSPNQTIKSSTSAFI